MDRQHGAAAVVARLGLREIDQAHHLERQREILQHDAGQLVRVARLQQRQPRRAVGAAGHRRQQADVAHASEQQRDGAGFLLVARLQPAFERALERARVAVALALLAVGGAIDDGAQRLGDRARHRPRQAHHLVAERRQAADDLRDVLLLQRRRAGQHLVHHQAEGQHVDLGGLPLHATLVHCGLLAVGIRLDGNEGLGERLRVDDLQAQQLDVAGVVHQQRIRLQVAVGAARFMGERQALQHLHAPLGQLGPGQALGGEPLAPGDERVALVDRIGPALVLADMEHAGEPGMLQAAGAADAGEPGAERIRVGRPRTGHREHHFDVAMGILRQPQHRLRALSEQAQQLIAAEHAHRPVGRGRTRGGSGGGGNGGDHERSDGRIARLERRRTPGDGRKKGRNGA